jgi:hypothetical protein
MSRYKSAILQLSDNAKDTQMKLQTSVGSAQISSTRRKLAREGNLSKTILRKSIELVSSNPKLKASLSASFSRVGRAGGLGAIDGFDIYNGKPFNSGILSLDLERIYGKENKQEDAQDPLQISGSYATPLLGSTARGGQRLLRRKRTLRQLQEKVESL